MMNHVILRLSSVNMWLCGAPHDKHTRDNALLMEVWVTLRNTLWPRLLPSGTQHLYAYVTLSVMNFMAGIQSCKLTHLFVCGGAVCCDVSSSKTCGWTLSAQRFNICYKLVQYLTKQEKTRFRLIFKKQKTSLLWQKKENKRKKAARINRHESAHLNMISTCPHTPP